MQKISPNPQYQEVSSLLKKFIDSNEDIKPDLIRREIQSLFYKIIFEGIQFSSDDNKTYELKYHRDDPNHRIDVFVDGDYQFNFQIQTLVKFENWISDKPKPSDDQLFWGAYGDQKTNLFHLSYDILESHILDKNPNFKMAIRLMRKLARRHNIVNLDDCFVKNICLSFMDFIDLEMDIYKILDDILERLNNSLEVKEINNYWHPDENLLSSFTNNEIDEMMFKFAKVYKMWKNSTPEELNGLFREFFLKLFLSIYLDLLF